ncbi:MAG: hypothetical protein HON90_00100 [Halobacteriovoraceae bacterium]|jgi:hypothetical protein|nr:hypothetical protein [Halobacteriovoraceae bacterium]
MNANMFPIVSVDENELTCSRGNRSSFFKIYTIDLDQMDNREQTSMYQTLDRCLNNLEDDKFYKFYHIGCENYLNTNSNIENLSFEVDACESPLQTFFGDNDIYSDFAIYDDYLTYNGSYKRVISVKGFDESLVDYCSALSGVDHVLSFRKISNDKAFKKLELIRSAHQGSLTKSKRDFQSEGAYEQAEELIHNLTHGLESIFDFELYFLPKENSLKELNEVTKKLMLSLTQLGITPFIEGHSLKGLKSGLGEIFKELIPGVAPSFKNRSLPNKTTHLKYLIPLDQSYLMDSGISFYDQGFFEIFLDIFDRKFKNRNILVTGSTGGGKSVLVNKIVHTLLPEHPAVILDKGGSFQKLCLYHDGYNLEGKINPLDFKCPYYLREFILSVVDKADFNKLRSAQLLKEIKDFLLSYQGNSFFDLLEYLEDSFLNISLYFEDIKDFLTSDVSLKKDLLYVNIENFPKTQVASLIIYVLEYYKNIKVAQKVLVFDEAWSFLAGHEEYIDEKFREIRKSGALAIAIAQGFKDFSNLNGQLYTSLTNNSYFKFFFSQDHIDDHDVSDFDNQKIKELEYEKGSYSDCYFKTQDAKLKKILRIFLAPLEYELFHTEEDQNELFYKFYSDNRGYFLSNAKTIDSFVRLHHEGN